MADQEYPTMLDVKRSEVPEMQVLDANEEVTGEIIRHYGVRKDKNDNKYTNFVVQVVDGVDNPETVEEITYYRPLETPKNLNEFYEFADELDVDCEDGINLDNFIGKKFEFITSFSETEEYGKQNGVKRVIGAA